MKMAGVSVKGWYGGVCTSTFSKTYFLGAQGGEVRLTQQRHVPLPSTLNTAMVVFLSNPYGRLKNSSCCAQRPCQSHLRPTRTKRYMLTSNGARKSSMHLGSTIVHELGLYPLVDFIARERSMRAERFGVPIQLSRLQFIDVSCGAAHRLLTSRSWSAY